MSVSCDELAGIDRADAFDVFGAAEFLEADQVLTAKMLQVIKGT